MIEFANIGKSFGSQPALSDLNIRIEQGEIIALIGPSGSGKTTLLKLINAQHLPSTGSLKVGGKELSTLKSGELKRLRSDIGYIPQDLGLVGSLKVYQNVLLGKIGRSVALGMLRRFLFPTTGELKTVHEVLQRVGIPEKLYDTTSTLSGGQQQRVAVARALFQQPHTILADEPVSAVDPARARSMVELLRKIAEENKITVIMSIHNIHLAKEYFPRIIGLRGGRVMIDSEQATEPELDQLFQLEQQEEIG